MQSMQALEAVHPRLISDERAMRHCSEAMHSAFLRRQVCVCMLHNMHNVHVHACDT